MNRSIRLLVIFAFIAVMTTPLLAAEDDGSRKIFKEGILGAVTGAVASSQSGGEAGKGALIGAGTQVIGGAVLDTMMGGAQAQQGGGQQAVGQKILKEGALGAATGAIASSASGGEAGKGALIGAGTSVVGGALLDTIMGSGQGQQVPPAHTPPSQALNAQDWYQRGYQDGFNAGYEEGMNARKR